MNSRQLVKLGVPQDCVKDAIQCIQRLSKSSGTRTKDVKRLIKSVVESPETFTADADLCFLDYHQRSRCHSLACASGYRRTVNNPRLAGANR